MEVRPSENDPTIWSLLQGSVTKGICDFLLLLIFFILNQAAISESKA